tara:strand:+ start:3145 stop:3549 length:405 start_codon:yes stop_codon:yes gene_type:complete
MKKIRKFKIKSFYKSTGKLIPLSFNKRFPLKVKRIFFLYGKKNKIRGDHAHKKCSQFFLPITGKAVLNIRTLNTKKSIKLSQSSNTAILVPPKYWCSLKFLKKNSVVMVTCDKLYDYKDYLHTFKDYKKYLKNL